MTNLHHLKQRLQTSGSHDEDSDRKEEMTTTFIRNLPVLVGVGAFLVDNNQESRSVKFCRIADKHICVFQADR